VHIPSKAPSWAGEAEEIEELEDSDLEAPNTVAPFSPAPMAPSWAPKITGDTPCLELLEGSEDIFRDAIADLAAKVTKKAAKKVPKEPLVAL